MILLHECDCLLQNPPRRNSGEQQALADAQNPAVRLPKMQFSLHDGPEAFPQVPGR
jgi:hypothetical protein